MMNNKNDTNTEGMDSTEDNIEQCVEQRSGRRGGEEREEGEETRTGGRR